jgi:hypothetical protein
VSIKDSVKNVCRYCMTESDNVTHDIFRYLVLAAFINGMAEHWAGMITGKSFDMLAYGTGLGALILAVSPVVAADKFAALRRERDKDGGPQ